jgi:hypothetical protein
MISDAGRTLFFWKIIITQHIIKIDTHGTHRIIAMFTTTGFTFHLKNVLEIWFHYNTHTYNEK